MVNSLHVGLLSLLQNKNLNPSMVKLWGVMKWSDQIRIWLKRLARHCLWQMLLSLPWMVPSRASKLQWIPVIQSQTCKIVCVLFLKWTGAHYGDPYSAWCNWDSICIPAYKTCFSKDSQIIYQNMICTICPVRSCCTTHFSLPYVLFVSFHASTEEPPKPKAKPKAKAKADATPPVAWVE